MKIRNFVAKHDHNKGGVHKSNKDYDRKKEKEEIDRMIDEGGPSHSETMQEELEPIVKKLKCMHCKELFDMEELRPSGYCSPCLKEVRRMYNLEEPSEEEMDYSGAFESDVKD